MVEIKLLSTPPDNVNKKILNVPAAETVSLKQRAAFKSGFFLLTQTLKIKNNMIG